MSSLTIDLSFLRIVLGPEELTVVPTMMYCVIRNPVITDKDGVPVVDKYGQVKVRMGDEEYRFAQDPFPLYPGEALKDIVRPLPVVLPNSALRLRAVSDFEDGNVNRIAGEEWLFEGPGKYFISRLISGWFGNNLFDLDIITIVADVKTARSKFRLFKMFDTTRKYDERF